MTFCESRPCKNVFPQNLFRLAKMPCPSFPPTIFLCWGHKLYKCINVFCIDGRRQSYWLSYLKKSTLAMRHHNYLKMPLFDTILFLIQYNVVGCSVLFSTGMINVLVLKYFMFESLRQKSNLIFLNYAKMDGNQAYYE